MKQRETGELKASPKIYYEVIDVHLYRLRLIYAQKKGNYKTI